MSSKIPYLKIILCTIPIAVSIGTTIIGKTWVSNVFRNPDASEKGTFPAIASIGALEIIFLFSIVLLFALKA